MIRGVMRLRVTERRDICRQRGERSITWHPIVAGIPKFAWRFFFHDCISMFYLLTAWSRVIFEKLSGSQLVKKFPEICGSRRFVTAFTRARHLSLILSQISPVHGPPSLIYIYIYIYICVCVYLCICSPTSVSSICAVLPISPVLPTLYI